MMCVESRCPRATLPCLALLLVAALGTRAAAAPPGPVSGLTAEARDPVPSRLVSAARVGIALGPALLGAFDARAEQGARGMAQSQLSLSLPITEVGGVTLGGELAGRFGLVPTSGGTALVGLVGGFRAALSPRPDLDLGLSLRIAHIHDAPHSAWTDHTGETLAGDPSWGLAHITAGGAAFGLAWAIPGMDGRLVLTAEVELLGRIHGHGERGLPGFWLAAPVGLAWRI